MYAYRAQRRISGFSNSSASSASAVHPLVRIESATAPNVCARPSAASASVAAAAKQSRNASNSDGRKRFSCSILMAASSHCRKPGMGERVQKWLTLGSSSLSRFTACLMR